MAETIEQFFKNHILPAEGGYRPPKFDRSGRMIDEPTMMGYRTTEFVRDIDAAITWIDKGRSNIDPLITNRMRNIKITRDITDRDKNDEVAAKALAVDLFANVGSHLKVQENNSVQGATSHQPNSVQDVAVATSMQRVVYEMYRVNFYEKPKFNTLPTQIGGMAMDLAIHRGNLVSTWSVVNSAFKAGIINDKEFAALGYRYISPADMAVPSREMHEGDPRIAKRASYGNPALLPPLAEKINAATDQQKALMVRYMGETRTEYYKQQFAYERTHHPDMYDYRAEGNQMQTLDRRIKSLTNHASDSTVPNHGLSVPLTRSTGRAVN